MPERDLALIETAAREAGRIALGFAQGRNRVWDKGANDPVSEADIAIDTYLREHLTAARPDYGWLSEETEDDPARLDADRVFVVDPIDGTRAFVAGETTWAHSIAVVERGRPVAGVVLLPMKQRLYAAASGAGATLNGAPIRVSDNARLTGATILASRPTLEAGHWRDGVPEVTRAFRPSLAYRICLVAEGRFDAMLTLRDSWEWDIAAGALIAAEAGAAVSDAAAHPLTFNNPRPMTAGALIAGPALHDALAGRLNLEPARNGS